MLVQIQANKEVLVDTFSNVSAMPKCRIDNYAYNNNGAVITGCYYYLDSNDKEVQIKAFNRNISKAELDALYASLALNIPSNASFTAKFEIELLAGLKFIVFSEQRWGLTNSDWS